MPILYIAFNKKNRSEKNTPRFSFHSWGKNVLPKWCLDTNEGKPVCVQMICVKGITEMSDKTIPRPRWCYAIWPQSQQQKLASTNKCNNDMCIMMIYHRSIKRSINMIIVMRVDRVNWRCLSFQSVKKKQTDKRLCCAYVSNVSVCLRAHLTVFHFKKGQNFQFLFVYFLI